MKRLIVSASILASLLASAGAVSAHQGHVACQPWATGDVVPAAQTGTLGTSASAGATSGPNAISDALIVEHAALCEPTL